MTISTNTFLTFSAVGNREDLTNAIYDISPIDVPFQKAIAKVKAEATLHEWQTHVLNAAASNAQLEGDDVVLSSNISAATTTTRANNRCQISYKTVQVSGTQDAVNKAGRNKEIVFQMTKRNMELRRDMEFTLCNNQGLVTGTSTTARHLQSLRAWYVTNTNIASTGSNSTGSSAANDSTNPTALTESRVKTVLQSIWTSGGDPDMIMVGPFNKQVMSGFTGNNTRMQDTSNQKLVAAIDVYTSDFGTHKIVPNRFSRDRDCHLLTTDLWALATLRPVRTVELAKTGDAERGMVLAEYTLESRNEAGSGVVADLTTS